MYVYRVTEVRVDSGRTINAVGTRAAGECSTALLSSPALSGLFPYGR